MVTMPLSSPHSSFIRETIMKFRTAPLFLLVTTCMLFSACASTRPGPAERDAARLSQYMEHAGEPVSGFRFWRMDRWVSLGRSELAVYTEPNRAYLLQVAGPCAGLDFARSVALTSTQHRVSQKFDYVLFEDQRCSIAEIRPIDVKALKAARRAASADR
jgi:hypothetical protein